MGSEIKLESHYYCCLLLLFTITRSSSKYQMYMSLSHALFTLANHKHGNKHITADNFSKKEIWFNTNPFFEQLCCCPNSFVCNLTRCWFSAKYCIEQGCKEQHCFDLHWRMIFQSIHWLDISISWHPKSGCRFLIYLSDECYRLTGKIEKFEFL